MSAPNMSTLKVNEAGFITNYLISGPRETDFSAEVPAESRGNQIRYEQYLRSIVADCSISGQEAPVMLGADSRLKMPWKYYFSYGNWFVDVSTFYSVLQKVELEAAVILNVDRDMTADAVLWSYAAVFVWCNGTRVCQMDTPCYKPIQKADMKLELKAGANLIYVNLQNLGVRDTRTLFGIQLLNHRDEVTVVLPEEQHTKPYIERERWLSDLVLDGHLLRCPSPAPAGTFLGYDTKSPDFADVATRVTGFEISGKSEIALEHGKPYLLVACTILPNAGEEDLLPILSREKLVRHLEVIEDVVPVWIHGLTYEDNLKRIYESISDVVSVNRGDQFGFAIPNILARKYTGREREDDMENFLISLQQVEDRYDCSDFLVSGIIRYLKNYEPDAGLKARIEEVLLNYRYWMDQDGEDGMCFFSENHALLFYSSAMLAGSLYPDSWFTRANMNGKELHEFGRQKVCQWLTEAEEQGYEEFLSTVYMCVTFAALLNVIDYAEPEIADRAKLAADKMLTQLCMHTYRGSIIAPMGRVYREVIYPFRQAAQSLMNIINPEVPASVCDEWLSYYATSSYQFPENLIELMEQEIKTVYSTGNALIHLYKTKDYCMTSVQSPRETDSFVRWENLTLLEENTAVDQSTHAYTRSLNERFHGTTCFEPGVYGYQQHMWCAALWNDTICFANHPGGTFDASSMRPGYWYGNGVMPAVKQEENGIGAIYVIPEAHPIHFTHVFWADKKFDRMERSGNWLFGKRESGFIGLWCSEKLKGCNDQLFDSEYRAYGDESAYLCMCGCELEDGSFEAFTKKCIDRKPEFDKETKQLQTRDGFWLEYRRYVDKTQYI